MEMSSSTQPKDPGEPCHLFLHAHWQHPLLLPVVLGEESHWTNMTCPWNPENWMYALVTQANWWQDSQVYIIIYPTNGLEVALQSPSARCLVAWWGAHWIDSCLTSRALPQLNDAGFTAGFLSLKPRPVGKNLAWNLKATSTIDPPERKQGWLNQHKTIWMATG